MVVPLAFTWQHVLFANWPIATDRLTTHLPATLEPHTYDDTTWISLIPFRNVDTRPRGLPTALGIDIPEVNLRTYVTCDGEPGIYFFSLDMASLPGVLGARLTHHLPYYYAHITMTKTTDGITVSSRRHHPGDRPARLDTTYAPHGDPYYASDGTLAAFLTERRRLYTQAPDGTLRHTDVAHEQWPLFDVTSTIDTNTMFTANDFSHPTTDPTTYYSPGVTVTTTPSKQWRKP